VPVKYVSGSTAVAIAVAVMAVGWAAGCGQRAADRSEPGDPRATAAPATGARQGACSPTDVEKLLGAVRAELPQAAITVAACRAEHAYVSFQGPQVGVHNNQDVLFARSDGAWLPIAWGETSQGRFVWQTLQANGIDPWWFAETFPEAGVHVPPNPSKGSS
jgi:hypothetical protein